ncbi:Polynucleotide 5'-hydroxyl-kinase grc3 [Serendipita sp. 399]|nr:Polynucleotide 5'-hydroxyl-kinase grc3 [Serendipita sp. 399]
MVKGPKNTGKSMFTRMVANRLLQKYRRVAYLDCDIGQPEFTPPGMVSLHVLTEPIFGPPFTHLRNPFRAHFVGSTSIRSLPLHYQACVLQLLETYRLDIQYAFDLDEEIHDNAETEEVPLVINMFGWTKGVGAEITRDIEASANLTHVFTFDPDGISQTNEDPKLEEIHYTILEPIKPPQSDPTPADKRALMLMSYFHHKPADSATDANGVSNEGRPIQWQMDLPLCAMPPWEVKWAETFDRIILIGNGSEDVHRTEVLRALNGAIVALVELEPSFTEWSSTREQHDSSSASGSIPYVQGTRPPPPSSSHCIGYALIRSVRASTGILHLLTPVLPNSLERAREIVMGEIRLPIQGMLDHRPRAKTLGQIAGVDYANTPFLHWNTGLPGTPGSKNLRVRRNLMRKSQIER